MFPTGRDYPVANAYVSSALITGNLAICASAPFYQKHWDGVWKDEATGSTIRNRLNLTDFPFALTDAGACVCFDTFDTHIGVWMLWALQPPHKYQGKSGFQLCLYGDTVEV